MIDNLIKIQLFFYSHFLRGKNMQHRAGLRNIVRDFYTNKVYCAIDGHICLSRFFCNTLYFDSLYLSPLCSEIFFIWQSLKLRLFGHTCRCFSSKFFKEWIVFTIVNGLLRTKWHSAKILQLCEICRQEIHDHFYDSLSIGLIHYLC